MSVTLRVRAWVMLAASLAVCCLLAPAAAHAAAAEPSIEATSVDYAAGTVDVIVTAPQAARVRLQLSAETTSLVPVDGVTRWAGYRLAEPVSASAEGYSASGAVLWRIEGVLDPAPFTPRTPMVSIVDRAAIPSTASFDVDAGVPVTALALATDWGGPAWVETVSAGPSAHVRVSRIRMPYGPGFLRVRARNGFGTSPVRGVRVYNVGSLSDLPATGRIVLVDKRAMRAYDITARRVTRTWPVATGMPSTPTPSGLFRLGRARPTGGSWGVLRRPLARYRAGRWVPTSYYIHGTNDPWSIGMMASHGCVRMYNSHIREFSRVVPSGTRVRIR